jgi:hypothetical protein
MLEFVIQVIIYIFKTWSGTTAKNAAQGRLVGIEPTALRFRCRNRNRRAVGSIPTRGPCAAFFAAVPGQISNIQVHHK